MIRSGKISIIIILALVLLPGLSLRAQTRVVKGELTVFNKFPVGNVVLSAKKAKTSVTVDLDGKFELVCKEKDVLVVKNKVFTPLSIRVGKRDDYVKVNLVFKDSPKNRELATGMGYIKEEQLSYALEHLASENNDFCNYADVFSLIKSKFPGVEVKSSPSGGLGVYIRGQKSLQGDESALYVVNGVLTNDISFIVPCEISEIDILKGTAAAMYGGRGANGVVVIETKTKEE